MFLSLNCYRISQYTLVYIVLCKSLCLLSLPTISNIVSVLSSFISGALYHQIFHSLFLSPSLLRIHLSFCLCIFHSLHSHTYPPVYQTFFYHTFSLSVYLLCLIKQVQLICFVIFSNLLPPALTPSSPVINKTYITHLYLMPSLLPTSLPSLMKSIPASSSASSSSSACCVSIQPATLHCK